MKTIKKSPFIPLYKGGECSPLLRGVRGVFSRNSFLNILMTVILMLLAWKVAAFIPNLSNPSISAWLQGLMPVFPLVLIFVVTAMVKFSRLPLFSMPEPITLGRSFQLALLAVILGLITFTIISMPGTWVINMIELFILSLVFVVPVLCLAGKTATAVFMLFLSFPAIELLRTVLEPRWGIAGGSVLNPFLIFQETITAWTPKSEFLGNLPIETLLVTGLFGSWLLNLYLRQGRWQRTSLDLPIAIFLAGCLISIPFSSNISKSIAYFIWGGLVPFMLYYVVVNCVKTPTNRRTVFTAMLLFAAVTDYYNLHRIIQSTGLSLSRFSENIRVATMFWTGGIFAASLWPLALMLSLDHNEKPVTRIVAILTLLLGFADILLSFSRAVWLIVAIQTVLLAVFSRRMRPYVLALALLLSVGLFFGNAWHKLSSTVRPNMLMGLEERDWNLLSSKRIFLWQKSWEWIMEKPFTGIGLDTSIEHFLQHYETNAHNDYLQFWLEGGILPAIAMVVIQFIVLAKGIRSVRSANNIQVKELRYSIFLGCLSWVLLSFVGSFWWAYPAPILQRVALWGLVMSWGFGEERQSHQNIESII